MKKFIVGALGLGILVTGFSSISYANESNSIENNNSLQSYKLEKLDNQNSDLTNENYRNNYNDCCDGYRNYQGQNNR